MTDEEYLKEDDFIENTYDELGRLSTKTYHQNDSLKSTYTYNIRNWLTGITGSKFTQKLFYNIILILFLDQNVKIS